MNRNDFPAYPAEGSYLDSATINLLSKKTIDAMSTFDMTLGSTPRKVLYERSRKTTEIYLDVKEKLVAKFGTKSHNYAFTPSLDYSWNQIFRSIIDLHDTRKTKLKVITTYFEHNSLLVPLQYLSTIGKINLQILSDFQISDSLTDLIDSNTVIALNHISPILGKYRDLQKVSDLVKSHGALLIVDYSRSAGQTIIDITQSDIAIIDPSTDLLSPQGVSIIYMNDEVISSYQNALPGSGSIKYVSSKSVEQLGTIERFEVGNVNMRALNGLKQSLTDLKSIESQINNEREKLQTYLRNKIDELEFVKIVKHNDDLGTQDGNIITLSMSKSPIHDTVLLLEEIGKVEVRSGRLCAHMGLEFLNLDDVIQISTHIYNDKSDVDRLIDALQEVNNIF
ncbi:MAG: aminotransferase class V-fold PLP-dependent enzyme [Candidatus Heimdallarchaeota archaeon]|nr:aminotransferase class V-fold PLP-dependent enzyme [Candidatus Heimdallarchaeota archaeon]